MKRNILIALFAALMLCGCSVNVTNTYWRNDKTGEWVMGITENNLVYDSKVWNITSKSEVDDAYTIEARCGQETILVSIGKESADKRIITVNGTEMECSLIDDQYLPDYPETDNTPLVNNNYVEGDSVTIKGWIMPEPSVRSWLREKRNNYSGALGEVSVRIKSIYTGAEKTYNAPIDSLGRFTFRIPLENTTFFYLNYGSGYARMVAEPNETYFLLVDPIQRKKLFMGQNARLQNELNAHFLEPSSISDLDAHEIGGIEKLRDSVIVQTTADMQLLEKTYKEHPTLSEKYRTFMLNRILSEKATTMMFAYFLKSSGNLPEAYLKFIKENYWDQMDEIYTLVPDNFERFPWYYWRELNSIIQNDTIYTLQWITDKAERAGIIHLSAKEKEAVKQYDITYPIYKEKMKNVPDSVRWAIEEEFSKTDFMTVIRGFTRHNEYQDYVQPIFAVRNLGVTLMGMKARGWSQTAQDIYLCRRLIEDMDDTTDTLYKEVRDFVDATIQLPVARNAVHAIISKYATLGKGNQEKVKPEDMCEGEKVMHRLCEPYKGRAILVDFWGTWCAPCKEDLSHSQEEYEQLKDYDIVYMYLAWNSKEEDCQKIIEQYNLTGPNIVHHILTTEEQNAIENYLGIHSFPSYRLIGPKGNLIDVEVYPSNTYKLKKILDKLK